MEAVTDLVFRQVITKAGRPDLFYTEFTCVDSFVSEAGKHNALKRLEFLPNEQPIVAQIWGSKPEYFKATAIGLKKLGYQAIDINMGCPDKAVIKTGGGSDLIRHPELANKIINATKEAGLAVSVKTRLGYSKTDEYKTWLKNLLEQNIDCLTVHLRTKKEMSKVDAHYELIPEIVKLRDEISPSTKLAINGDIKDKEQALKLCNDYKLDGAMIGRGVFSNPYCFTSHSSTQNDLVELLEHHLDLFDKEPNRKYDPLKRFFKIYLHDFDGAKDLRTKLMETRSTAEARQLLGDFKSA